MQEYATAKKKKLVFALKMQSNTLFVLSQILSEAWNIVSQHHHPFIPPPHVIWVSTKYNYNKKALQSEDITAQSKTNSEIHQQGTLVVDIV